MPVSSQGTHPKRGLARFLGITIGGAGLALVVYQLIDGWDDVEAALQGSSLGELGIAAMAGLLGMLTIGLNWTQMLRGGGTPLSWTDGLHAYFVGQLGKYIPGGIWPIVGRAELARLRNVSRPTAYSATLLSLATTYLAALVVSSVLSPAATDLPSWVLLVLLALPLGLLALHPRTIRFLVDRMPRITGRALDFDPPAWSHTAVLVVRHVPAWLFIAAATYATSQALGGNETFARIGLATCISWFLGFVVVGLPGGLGVREAVFTTVSAGLEPGLAAAIAIAARTVFIVVDLVGALLLTVARRLVSQRKTDS